MTSQRPAPFLEADRAEDRAIARYDHQSGRFTRPRKALAAGIAVSAVALAGWAGYEARQPAMSVMLVERSAASGAQAPAAAASPIAAPTPVAPAIQAPDQQPPAAGSSPATATTSAPASSQGFGSAPTPAATAPPPRAAVVLLDESGRGTSERAFDTGGGIRSRSYVVPGTPGSVVQVTLTFTWTCGAPSGAMPDGITGAFLEDRTSGLQGSVGAGPSLPSGTWSPPVGGSVAGDSYDLRFSVASQCTWRVVARG